MVSRRQGNLNLRIPALPGPREGGKHGLYYHVTFHDLQASNHLTMFPSPVELIKQELTKAFKAGAKDYLLVNSGNILPHLNALDFTAEMWRNEDADAQRHLTGFIKRMYGEERPDIIRLYEDYAACTIPYGAHEDERAGEEFYHHPTRQMIGHWLQGQTCTHERLIWATGDVSFADQVRWFRSRAEQAIPGWEALQQRGRAVAQRLSDENSRRLYIQMLVQIELHLTGCRGLASICHAYADYCSGAYPQAFVQAARAVRHYSRGLDALRAAESGQWEHFYRADWLTNISNTVHHASTLRSFLRMHGDSPDMFLWYKEYLMPETEKHIYLENTHRNPLPDDRLAELLEERLFELGVLDSRRVVSLFKKMELFSNRSKGGSSLTSNII